MRFWTFWRRTVFSLALFLALLQPAPAQQRAGEVDALATGGAAWFTDGPRHSVFGGSVRFHLSDRFAVEPEFLHMGTSQAHHDQVFVASVVYHFTKESRMAPFVMGGVGAFRQTFGQDAGRFSTTDVDGLFGTGLRVNLTNRIFVEPRLRIGVQDLYIVLTGSIGFALTGR